MKEYEDPVVAEVRAVRQELSDRFGDDIEALCDFLAEQEQRHPERLVSRRPNPVQTVAVRRGE